MARPDKVGNGGAHNGANDGVGEESTFVGMKKGMSYGQMVAGNAFTLFILPTEKEQYHLSSLLLPFLPSHWRGYCSS